MTVQSCSFGQALRQATRDLQAAGVPSPRRDAALLLAHVTRCDTADVERSALLGHALTSADIAAYELVVAERSRRIPLQHITGLAPFRHLELCVGPGVFVPRPETEMLAGLAIDAATTLVQEGVHEPLVVDLCTGSAAIALAIATEVPQARVIAVELSCDAAQWAECNITSMAAQVELRRGDATAEAVTGDLDGIVDIVVSNPPYIPPDAIPIDPEVAEHDPAMALYGLGDDGLAIPTAVAWRASGLLRPGGLFLMEHADVQGKAIVDVLLGQQSWVKVHDQNDDAGRPRHVVATRATSGESS
ncbi:peptide chain release factor N(5)-glutamine methyltransferase [Dermatophilus congolensis]|uniref:peptide chain release factor N(5)-glutamine methyltransferase n=1 Tax=Dermatophilus congolensis TaxID=1863 RepID=UPI001AAECC55|nr:peptide chain release factor N(5)-glutamine methyltransferase [Dermatophilus congolensis]MBO3128708.1 peptide chain release factor N(5)-glutamine methyltransferase [Dermatophilus congolensis]MBO3132655.1 peptide chain release factor N(5)-glutamine methyltransferase [Dermatophilus congolensis]MBO3133184.1 peptide chain release factor N(5)-glutamine methyltransferase [Dermatophilus congolensis]MBO3135419.1 peptide chain release factor N(5)-glutamine methyltransferase [Dermatophilus congolensis